MGYTGLKPADTQTIAQGPADIRDELAGLATGQVVNAGMLNGISAGNASGKIPVSNGTVNTNLNADKLDGLDASAFASASHTHNIATTSSNGIMSNTDKAKLDGIAAGAQVNQNAFSNVLVGSTTIQADNIADTLELVAGNNISLTPDATNDRVTIAVTGTVAAAATAAACTGNATSATTAANCTGNSATATKLAFARTIALNGKVTGTATGFDGSGNITIPVTSVMADSCTGNAATATKLATTRTITLTGDVTGATTFDGSGNASIATTVTTGMPVGFTFAILANTPPAGCLRIDQGSLVSRSAYPDLWTWVQANAPLITETAWQAQAAAQSSVGAYSSGDGSTTFRLPRIVDFVRGSDATRTPGAWQEDAMQNVIGQFGAKAAGDNTPTGPFYAIVPNSGGSSDHSAPGPELIGFDLSRAARTADETRPKSVAMLYCVKAFGVATNQGAVDVTALANQINTKIDKADSGYGTKVWVSGEYTPVVNTSMIVSHGLAIDPLKCRCDVLLKCINAEAGYSVGDYAINICTLGSGSEAYAPLTPALGTSTIQINNGGIRAFNKATGTIAVLTVAKWAYVFRVWY
ncbi:hypothetical protein EV210_103276 [Anaerospora hongkongensis]|uniref:Tail collar domain n=1 Tax=Anaerospora hongkongensis TaxID=244830 RepID=A0A4R1Q0E0_9FIRM|nr:phage tail protein [Anaerospora hongkongensis]TCL38793.1 hypothetical protein EV210_103276 [Anaerospora hongkongensis]